MEKLHAKGPTTSSETRFTETFIKVEEPFEEETFLETLANRLLRLEESQRRLIKTVDASFNAQAESLNKINELNAKVAKLIERDDVSDFNTKMEKILQQNEQILQYLVEMNLKSDNAVSSKKVVSQSGNTGGPPKKRRKASVIVDSVTPDFESTADDIGRDSEPNPKSSDSTVALPLKGHRNVASPILDNLPDEEHSSVENGEADVGNGRPKSNEVRTREDSKVNGLHEEIEQMKLEKCYGVELNELDLAMELGVPADSVISATRFCDPGPSGITYSPSKKAKHKRSERLPSASPRQRRANVNTPRRRQPSRASRQQRTNVLKNEDNLEENDDSVQYIPDTFSAPVTAFLNGEQFSYLKRKKLRNIFIRELTNYLDENNLITSRSPSSNRVCYRKLRDQLRSRYELFDWMGEGNSGSHGMISQLSNRRRQYRMFHSRKRSVQSLKDLETFMDLQPTERSDETLMQLLKETFLLRNEPIQKIPTYFFSKAAMICEIELRTETHINLLISRLNALVAAYRTYTKNTEATIADVEAYFHPNDSTTEKFLEITKDSPSTDLQQQRPGPCVTFVKDKNACYLWNVENQRFQHITGDFSMLEAILVGFGAYSILNIDYPDAFEQFLALLASVLNSEVTKISFPQ